MLQVPLNVIADFFSKRENRIAYIRAQKMANDYILEMETAKEDGIKEGEKKGGICNSLWDGVRRRYRECVWESQ